MPRRTRMYLPGYPYHIVQRGNNRQACFKHATDYQVYLDLWQQCSSRYDVAVHAYCLMTNHIHFLATPSDANGLSNTMKVVGSRFAAYINRTYNRTGTLWEGRHRSSLVQTSRYLLCCYRYIELNPVRALMVKQPEDYPWSSYQFNAWGTGGWLTQHDEYLNLGISQSARCTAYRALLATPVPDRDLSFIRVAAHYNQPVAVKRFCAQLEQKYGMKFGYMKRGRPRRTD